MAHHDCGVPPLKIRFVTSAAKLETLPATRAELALIGRSNVGKSSLINAVANHKQLARVSKTPGRTQLINLFELPSGDTIVDLPGYGYANAPKAVRSTWGPMTDRYLLGRENLRRILLLVDGEIGPTKLDLEMLEWLRSSDLAFAVIATKHDKVKSSKRTKRKREFAEACNLAEREITWVSASTGVNLDLLRERMLAWLRNEPIREAAE